VLQLCSPTSLLRGLLVLASGRVQDHFSDGQKRATLENAVRDVDELRQVKVNADLERTMTGKVLTYDQYAALLLSTAVGYDTHRAGGNRSRVKQVVYQHELEAPTLVHDYDYVDESFDIDYPVEQLSINVHRRRPASPTDQRVRLPFDRWSKLSDDAKKVWDTLDDQAKAVILGSSSPKPPPTRVTPPRGPARRHVNLHDMSAYDLLQAFVAHTSVEEDLQASEDCEGTPILVAHYGLRITILNRFSVTESVIPK